MSEDGNRITASAPGGIGNIGPGLDVLGCAVVGARDEITVARRDEPGIEVADAGHHDLPRDPARHTAALAAAAVLRRAGAKHGLTLWCRKGLPLSGGQGGSAASAVAGAVATNALLGNPLGTDALLASCLDAESAVAGRHLDNIAASLLGGIVLVRTLDPIEVIKLPVPTGLILVLAHPAQRLTTVDSRRALPDKVSRSDVIQQIGNAGAMVAACYTGTSRSSAEPLTTASRSRRDRRCCQDFSPRSARRWMRGRTECPSPARGRARSRWCRTIRLRTPLP